MKISLYVNYSANNKINKSLTPMTIGGIDCTPNDSTSMITPSILIYDTSIDIYRCNYAYVDTFARYYYITDIVTTPEFIELVLSVDVLMSYRSGILGVKTLIQRQEFLYNLFISDPMLPVRSERGISYQKIGSLGDDHSILLTVTGAVEEEGDN